MAAGALLLTPSLGADEVHVWRASLSVDDGVVRELAAPLEDDERARASRYARPRDAARFLTVRGMLRKLLGGYMGCSPRAVMLRYGAHGKPFVVGGPSFNVSCSGTEALLAFGHQDLGIDLERHGPLGSIEGLAQTALSPWERSLLGTIPPEWRARAFYACWVCKEAFLKLTGEGIRRPLDSFDVSFWPIGSPHLVRAVDMLPEELPSLRMLSGEHRSAALAVRGSPTIRELDLLVPGHRCLVGVTPSS